MPWHAKRTLRYPHRPDITQAASRYVLASGRSLPSEGLNIQQICEAARAAGLEPLVMRSLSLEQDRAQLLGYISSGFAPVLAIQTKEGIGHAVCAVGVKLGPIQPQSDPTLHFRDNARQCQSFTSMTTAWARMRPPIFIGTRSHQTRYAPHCAFAGPERKTKWSMPFWTR